MSYYTAGWASTYFASGAAGAAMGGAVAGYLSTGTLKGAAFGMLGGLAAYGIGHVMFAGSQDLIGKSLTHGIAQGALSEAGGGRFGDGFLGGFTGSLLGPIAKRFPSGPAQTIAVATIGGTVSRLGGGKFANGAIAGAFAAAFGNMAQEQGGTGGGGTKSLLRDENGNLVQSDEVLGPFVEGDYVVSSEYGDVRIINGTENLHAGVDFVPMNVDGTVNTNAYAISGTEGTLVYAGVSDSFGNYVLVKTPGDNYVFYAHLNQHASNIPANINVGTRLGIIGNTGRSTGLHLHVEIRQGSWEVTAPRLGPGSW